MRLFQLELFLLMFSPAFPLIILYLVLGVAGAGTSKNKS